MAYWLTGPLSSLAADPVVLALAVVLDLAIGDPAYAWHPVRIIGNALTWMEGLLRGVGLSGYAGGILLFVGLATSFLLITGSLVLLAGIASVGAARVVDFFFVYSLFSLGDLIHHVWRIESAVQRHDLAAARTAVSALVGRDTERLDGGGCRRAAVESLSENLTDGFVSPVFWYVLLGLPGLVLFKVVSTMDSMVGYKTPRYLQFGWCGARLDDVMNYLPARFTWLAIVSVAGLMPMYSGRKAWVVGLRQHALLLGPNSGWSEAAAAGALQRRIVGPIWRDGVQVTDLWIGDPGDPPLERRGDVIRALVLAIVVGVLTAAAGGAWLALQ